MVPHGDRHGSLTADMGARWLRCRRPYSTRNVLSLPGVDGVHAVPRDTQALTRSENAVPERRPAGR